MGVLQDFANAQAVNEALKKGAAAHAELGEIKERVEKNETDISLLNKNALMKNQGAENVGKILSVDEDGNIVLINMPSGDGDVVGYIDENNNIILRGNLDNGSYTMKYYYGVDEDGNPIYSDSISVVVGENSEPDTPTYANLIPLATDSSGNPYVGANGEAGYKDGFKISVTSGNESSATGYKCTGFIPVNYEDTIYFKGIGFESDGTNTNYCLYDGDKNRIAGGNWSKVFAGGVTGEVVSVIVNDTRMRPTQGTHITSDVAFIRFSASMLDENSIVTVNEPLE